MKLLLILSCLFVASCASTSQVETLDGRTDQNLSFENMSGHSPGAIKRLDQDF